MRPDPSSDPVLAEIEARDMLEDEKDRVRAKAAAKPLPGPLGDAFAPVQDILVGPYKVRAVCDLDVELWQHAKHPMAQVVEDLLTTGRSEVKGVPRGPSSWLLSWMLTHSPDEVDQAFADGTAEAKAKAEFGRLQIAAILRLYEAAQRQVVRYTDTMVAYGPADEKPAEGGQVPPPQGGQPGTASAGSSRSGAGSCGSTAGTPTT